MLKVGLTGGIGSGKSTVACIFGILGIPVYTADRRAQILMHDPPIQEKITALLGPKAFKADGSPDRAYIASRVFENTTLLSALNAIVHPAVRADFEAWCLQFTSKPYVVQEAAILFESGGSSLMDENILVWAPVELRISRVIARDKITRSEVEARMQHQWLDEQKVARSKFIIVNDDFHSLIRQVVDINLTLTYLDKHN